jgi:hypothetical protein
MSKDPDQEELDELIGALVPEQVSKPVDDIYDDMKDIFYCFSCMGECDPDKHEDMKRYHSGPARFTWSFDAVFRPRVILARGNLEGVVLKSFCIGYEEQLINYAPMKWFQSPFEFPALAGLLRAGCIPAGFPQNLVFCTIPLGVPLTFELSAHVTDFGLWGCTARPQPRKQRETDGCCSGSRNKFHIRSTCLHLRSCGQSLALCRWCEAHL